MVHLGSPEITIRNKVPERIFSLGLYFLQVFPGEPMGTIFFVNEFLGKNAPSRNTCYKRGSPENTC
jgi:hypothetical protein